MSFLSILYEASFDRTAAVETEQPAFFVDLNLDQVVASVTAGRKEYDLEPFFYAPLRSVEAIAYRHEVLADLESADLLRCVDTFAEKMRSVREHLAQAAQLHYKYQQESWFLEAVDVYCGAVDDLTQGLHPLELRSRGFMELREHLTAYIKSEAFTALVAEIASLRDDLAGVTYCLRIVGSRIKVSRYDSEPDYSADVSATFEKFRQGGVKDHRATFPSSLDMNHVEAGILQIVSQLYPLVFSALDEFCQRHRDYLDPTIATFDREVQFYMANLEFASRLRHSGLSLCYPQVSDGSKDVFARDTFDVALADKLVRDGATVVCNDFSLTGAERIFVVTGPNQGGKTTFARTFGQLHYLSSIGCLVPGSQSQLPLCDQVFTHFERGENLKDLSGKLQDDLLRIRQILQQATPDSVVILNEIFTSTTLQDAVLLGTKVLEDLIRIGCLSVCVTFVDEWASLSESTISMVSTVVPDDPATRTYKVVRRPADGLSYAKALAEKYGLTYECLKSRTSS